MKISIVTPSSNAARFIREAMTSVITQSGDFRIEYIVVDNASNDGTREIVGTFQDALASGRMPLSCTAVELVFVSEPDNGMYDAIGKGFARATGDVHAWLNADDMYLPGAFSTMSKVFHARPDIQWAKGITTYATEGSTIWQRGECLLYAQDWIKAGVYGRDHHFIQQDSVFWRSSLLDAAGGIDAAFRLAGDYDLWIRFAQLAPLVSVNSMVSCFRRTPGQLSEDLSAYLREARRVSSGRDPVSVRARRQLQLDRYLPGFLSGGIGKLLFGTRQFSALVISPDGTLESVSGDFRKVRSKL